MREIILDTETTGFEPDEGHRIIEIGCLEVHNYIPTGRTFHHYLNPDRDVPPDAVAVHGITTEFLADKPRIDTIIEPFLEFIGDAPLVIHNAVFDLKFLNFELKKNGYKPLTNPIVDTVIMARKMFPGQPASLDALCRRYKIDLTGRTYHGALLDSELLADVYLELKGGRQQGLSLTTAVTTTPLSSSDILSPVHGLKPDRSARPARVFELSPDECTAHEKLIAALGDQAVWKKYITV